MLNRLSNDPIQTAIAQIERQHEEDKQGNKGIISHPMVMLGLNPQPLEPVGSRKY